MVTGSGVIALPAIAQALKIQFADASFYLITPLFWGQLAVVSW